MITKEELLSIPQLSQDIVGEQARIETIKSRLYSPKGLDTSERVQSSAGNQTALADIVIDLEQRLDVKRDKLQKLQAGALRLIYQNDLDNIERIIFTLRYTERQCMGWKEIADVIHYSEPTVYRRHREVLDKIYSAGGK